ncbi:MAG: hypothetical protein CL477_16300 [Acidobacteria bacterium]|nr:hypothetical protein [Acidobacteriota bacterium]
MDPLALARAAETTDEGVTMISRIDPLERSQTRRLRRVTGPLVATLVTVLSFMLPVSPVEASLRFSPAGASRASTIDRLVSRSLGERLEVGQAKGRKKATRLDAKLRKLIAQGGAELVRVIIQVRPGTERKVASAIRGVGFKTHGKLPLIGSIVATLPVEALKILANHPDVLGISTDELVRTQGAKKQRDTGGAGKGRPNATSDTSDTSNTSSSSTSTGGSWQTENLIANHLLNTLGLDDEPWDGQEVHVAIIDSGVAAFFELSLFGTWSFLNGAYPKESEWVPDRDPYGHGTHVAGLIANDGVESGGLFRGVAPNIDRIYSLRVLDKDGAGYTSDVIRAIQWTIENSRAKIDIINLSLGHPILEPAATDPLVQAVEAAVRAGIVVVVSAGNYGYDRETGEIGYAGISSPGNAPSAITVGAIDTLLTDTRSDDSVARFSSRGPTWYDAFAKPDIVAPGSSLMSATSPRSTLLFDNPQLEVDSQELNGVLHMRLSGTSMAAAVTTGVVARMISAQKQVFGRKARPTPNVVKAMLQYSAVPLAGTDVLTQGAGALNADGAVALAASIDTSARDGEWWLSVPTTETSTIVGETLTWGQRFIWGDRFIWGSTIYYANTGVWSPVTVWGDRFIWGSQINWDDLSTSVVWGDRFIWGSNIVWGDNLLGVDDGTQVLWGDRFIWGTVSPDRFIWGSLDDGTAGQTTVR